MFYIQQFLGVKLKVAGKPLHFRFFLPFVLTSERYLFNVKQYGVILSLSKGRKLTSYNMIFSFSHLEFFQNKGGHATIYFYYHICIKIFIRLQIWRVLYIYILTHRKPQVIFAKIITNYRVSQKNATFLILEYIKDGSVKLIFLLVCYLVLPYNSIKPNFYDSLERRYCVSKYKYNF